jgi:hypothetical protein
MASVSVLTFFGFGLKETLLGADVLPRLVLVEVSLRLVLVEADECVEVGAAGTGVHTHD